jgi:hypothetical protein
MRFALPEWATKPEFFAILSILSLLLTVIFGLWGTDIRRIIHIRPRATRKWWRSARLDSFRVELNILKRCHNNAYELVLHALTQLGRMAILSCVYVGVVIIFAPALHPDLMGGGSDRDQVLVWASSQVTLALAFAVANLYFDLRHLRHYEWRVAYLEKKIAPSTLSTVDRDRRLDPRRPVYILRVVAVVAPPTAQQLFRYFQKRGDETRVYDPLDCIPAECKNMASVQTRIP